MIMNYWDLYPFINSINLDISADLFFFLVKQHELLTNFEHNKLKKCCLKSILTKRKSLFGVKCYKRTDDSIKSHHIF